jgi:hypothetical protein
MPIYSFRNKDTEEEFDLSMGMSDLDKYLKKNKNIEHVLKPIALSSHANISGKKPDAAFRDRLKEIKKKAERGISRSTINTW